MVDAIQNSFQERLSSLAIYFLPGRQFWRQGTAQFKLDRTCVQQGHNTTRHVFYLRRMQACVCTQDDDVKLTVQSSHVRTISVHDARVHVRNAHTKFGFCVHANCKPRTANKLYKHVMY